ncbi:MAG: OmpH family outer membrane protein [Proteobacteria bacterium]|nr:OmpH family outer membrane protein [Pseudomonadota bacterium]
MKKYGLLFFALFVGLLLVLSSSYAIAADKIGFVDVRKVMLLSETGKKAALEFKKAFEKDKAAIQREEAKLRKLKETLEKQRSILTPDAIKEKEIAYQKKFRDYQRLVKDSNEALQLKDRELSRKLIPEILKVVNTIGKKEKYTLILDVNTQGVAFHSKGSDITDKVIKEFNKSYKAKK